MRPFDPKLLRELPATRLPVAILALLGGAGGIIAIAQALAVAHLVVDVVRGHSFFASGAWVIGLFIARGLCSGLVELAAARAATRISGALREAALERWLNSSVESRPNASSMLTMATKGGAAVEPYISRYLPALVTSGVIPVLAVATMLFIDWRSALIVIFTLPLLPLFAALIGKFTQRATEARWVETTLLAGHFSDVVTGLPTLVNYGRGEQQVEQIDAVGTRHRSATMKTLRIAFLSSAALDLLAPISVAMVAVAVGIRLSHGNVSLLTGLSAILVAPEAFWPIRRVGQEFHAAADGVEAIDSLMAGSTSLAESGISRSAEVGTARQAQSGPASEAAPSGIARAMISDVSYTYPGAQTPAVNGVTALVREGLTVITGPSGVGKSTLLELLAGARTPTRGRMEVPATHFVTQRPFIAPMSVEHNVRFGNNADDAALHEAMATTGLDAVVASLPDGLSTVLGDDGFGLSAGQRARLVLTRALLSDAPIVLLDEPTAHLDPASATAIREVIRHLARRKPVITVTHDEALIDDADHQWQLNTKVSA